MADFRSEVDSIRIRLAATRASDTEVLRLLVRVPYQGTGQTRNVATAIRASEGFRQSSLSLIFQPDAKVPELQTARKRLAHPCSWQLESATRDVHLLLSHSIPSVPLSIASGILSIAEPRIRNRMLEHLADTLHYYKAYSEARQAYHAILTLVPEPDARACAHANRGLGDCASKAGKLDEAHARFLSAIATYRRIRRGKSLARTERSLGTVYRKLGKFHLARQHYDIAERLAIRHQYPWELAKVLQERGWLCLLEGRKESAGVQFSAALPIYIQSARQRGKLSCLTGISLAQGKRGKIEERLRTAGKAIGHDPLRERLEELN